ncbi:hypothetical protein ACQY0O_000430 [Thecaphora frezii]
MQASLVIDDTSLLLLLAIVLALSLSIYTSRAYQPLIHPLILARQAEVSKVRQTNESAVYRNANTPSGFDLAEKPRKEALNIAALLAAGATGNEANHRRNVYDHAASNAEVIADAKAFAGGLAQLASASSSLQVCAAVSVDLDSYESLVALLAGAHAAEAGSVHTLVLPPSTLVQYKPTSLPTRAASAGVRAINFLVTTLQALEQRALSLELLDHSAVVVLPSRSEAEQAGSLASGSGQMRFVSFQEVVEAGSSSRGPDRTAGGGDLAAVHSHYWQGERGWTSVSHGSLVAGVTTHLSLYPADKIPSLSDRIFVEASGAPSTPTAPLMAAASPSGLALALLALYTGASLMASTLTLSWDDPNPAATKRLVDCAPTLIYASDKGASSLACALTTVSRRSPIAGLAAKSKLYTVRNGAYGRQGLLDRLVYRSSREATGCLNLRGLVIVGPGSSVTQGLLDSLRMHLGCAVQNAYLPAAAPRSDKAGATAYAVTAPVCATHNFDLQAFADQIPAHVGPPAVSVEVKLVQSARANSLGFKIDGDKPRGFEGDPMGEVYVRGKTVTGDDAVNQEWFATGDLAGFRTNGTLVVYQDSVDSEPVAVPTLSSRKPVLRQRRSKLAFGGKAATAALALVALLGVAGGPSSVVRAADVRKRSGNNSTLTELARMGMLAGQRASWEQGVAQSALLELDSPSWTVFTSNKGGPPYKPSNVRNDAVEIPTTVLSMAYHSAARQDRLGRLAFRITGDENITTGSALDGASPGEHVLLAAWLNGELDRDTGQLGRGIYANAARKALDYILTDVPRSRSGAISHRASSVSLWSDAIYMGPPFIAYYGLMTRNDSLLQLAYDQVRLYRDGLMHTEGSGAHLWGHIRFVDNGTWEDGGAWATGNGWVAAGMLRVLATIEQSPVSAEMTSQKTDLIDWITELLDAAYPLLDEDSLLFHNYMNETDTFLDAAGTALLTYATFRLASVTGNDRHVDQAERIYARLGTALTHEATFRDGFETVDVLGFTQAGDTSSESLSFMMLMDAARRDHRSGGIARITGTNAASTSGAGESRAGPVAVAVAVATSVAVAAAVMAGV